MEENYWPCSRPYRIPHPKSESSFTKRKWTWIIERRYIRRERAREYTAHCPTEALSVFQGYKKLPSVRWLKTSTTYCLPGLEDIAPKSRCWQDHAASEDPRETPPRLFLASDAGQQPLVVFCSYIILVSASFKTVYFPLCLRMSLSLQGHQA